MLFCCSLIDVLIFYFSIKDFFEYFIIRIGIVVMNSFCLLLSWEFFLFPSSMTNGRLCWQLLSFKGWNTLFQVLFLLLFLWESCCFSGEYKFICDFVSIHYICSVYLVFLTRIQCGKIIFWCPNCILYQDWHFFPKIWEILWRSWLDIDPYRPKKV